MIKIIAGGKKPTKEYQEIIDDYEKRLRKPYDIVWQYMDEDKLTKYLATWPFDRAKEYVICCDERGKNISSREYSAKLTEVFTQGKNVVILIGGAYGFTDDVRKNSDFVWSFSNLVFPHALARLIVTEQVYRAEEIAKGSPYHHD